MASSPGVPAAAFNLMDFGAVGDGVEDDGPALQRALDALAEAGGGELFVPEGRYAIASSVSKDFAGLASSVTIYGVGSSAQVPPPTSSGDQLTRGLNLVSEFIPRTGAGQVAIRISGLQSFLLKDISFMGTPDITDDALVTLYFYGIGDAVIRHCEFYGLSNLAEGGSIVTAVRSRLSIEQTEFLGCAVNSAVYSSVIQNVEWEGLSVSNTVFVDYGQRPELFGKLGYAAPFSWINLGEAAATGPDSPRREVSLREVFFDEGGLSGISSVPTLSGEPTAPFDLLYVTGLLMNVSNLNTSGHFLQEVQGVLIEKSLYGWSHSADTAINLLGVGNAILDEVECIADADTIRADAATTRLSVVNSTYGVLDSQAQTTEVVKVAPENDRVQHVRRRFEEVVGRAPDAAAHFYWSDRLLRCGEDSQCLADGRAALDIYLKNAPQTEFAVTGRVVDEGGAGRPGVTVALGGSQQVAAVTDADGRYRFSKLPTSGVYTVTPALRHYTLSPQSLTITTTAGDRVADFGAALNRHDISGRVTNGAGSALAGVAVLLSGSQTGKATTDADGNYSFQNLPAGGNYTITPSKTAYAFIPAAETFDDLSTDQTLDFSGTFVTYTIAGIVVAGNNTGVAGVKLTLSGSQNRTTTTDAGGNFSFADVPSEGSYTVTPTFAGYAFSPSSKTYNVLASNQYDAYFASFTTHSIGGRVTAAGGAGVA
ncbi:MAG: carboxypeptidase regulatory-like domain-containing protein, partial [Acidobacteria bacterium]|nr:carboxypeptidase regulatory-like domain-containing protein [Acidobacteriota bacterium]